MRLHAVSSLLLAASLLLPVVGALASQQVSSAGPLTDIWISDDLSCQVARAGDSFYEIYPPSQTYADCGTFVATGSTLFAPAFGSHGGTATASLGNYVAYTRVSQTGITGAGTASSPYTVVTVVDLPGASMRITQTDKYVVGDDFYRTDVSIKNTGAASRSLILYRAADCYLGGNDAGYGELVLATGVVGCSKNAGNTPEGRVEQLIPRSAGSAAYHASYDDVWSYIGSKQHFPDTCLCNTYLDNGMGISWSFTLAAGASTTRSSDLRFSVPPGLSATCTATGILVRERDPSAILGDLDAPFAQSATQSVATASGSYTLMGAQPKPLDEPAATSKAREAGAEYARTTPSPLFVSASGVFSRCETLAVGTNTSSLMAQAYGHAGVANVKVATCSSCTPLVEVQGVDLDMIAQGRASGTAARYNCDLEEVDQAGTRLTAICTDAPLLALGPSLADDPLAGTAVVTFGEVSDPVRGENGLWHYEGSAVHVALTLQGRTVDVYVGHVALAVAGGAAARAVYASNTPCTLPLVPCL